MYAWSTVKEIRSSAEEVIEDFKREIPREIGYTIYQMKNNKTIPPVVIIKCDSLEMLPIYIADTFHLTGQMPDSIDYDKEFDAYHLNYTIDGNAYEPDDPMVIGL